MKKTFLVSMFTLAFFGLVAQEIWIEAAAKGGYGVSFLHNSNIVNDDSYRYNISTTYGFGAKLAVNFGSYMGLSVEGMYNNLSQEFEYDLQGMKNFKNKVSWKSVDTYLLYRYTRNRVFLELGPMYSFLKTIKQDDDNQLLYSGSEEDGYEKNYLSAVFGWGGYLTNAETFTLGIGLRLHYGLTDFVSTTGESTGFPNPVKLDNYQTNKATHPAFVQLLLEFNFGIGQFAKAQCRERMHFYRARRR